MSNKEKRRNNLWFTYNLSLTIVLVFLFAVLLIIGFKIFDENTNQSVITSEGSAKIEVEPDKATAYFNINVNEKSKDKTMELATRDLEKLKEILKENNVKEEDIKTSNFQTYKDHQLNQNSEEENEKYRLTSTTEVKVNDLDKLEDIVDNALKIEFVDVSNIGFDYSDLEDIKQEALEKATKKAKFNANGIAKSLDVEIKSVKNIKETGGFELFETNEIATMDNNKVQDSNVDTNNLELNKGKEEKEFSVEAVFYVK